MATENDENTKEARSSAASGWALPELDKQGNATCKTCGKKQSPSFKACIGCCTHDELDFTEDWHGPDDGGGWELDVECAFCGINFDFSRHVLMREYRAVRRSPNDSSSETAL